MAAAAGPADQPSPAVGRSPQVPRDVANCNGGVVNDKSTANSLGSNFIAG